MSVCLYVAVTVCSGRTLVLQYAAAHCGRGLLDFIQRMTEEEVAEVRKREG